MHNNTESTITQKQRLIWFLSNLPNCVDFIWTRNSAISDKPRDAFRDQSRSPMV